MSNGHDLYLEIQNKIRYLDEAIRQLADRGRAYAQSEHDYKIALAKQMLIERDAGKPATIIPDLCRGNREVAKLRFDRDVAEVVYKSAQEAINSAKLQLRILDAQMAREWGAAK